MIEESDPLRGAVADSPVEDSVMWDPVVGRQVDDVIVLS